MKCAQQFPDLDTVWKIELVENGKSLEFLFCFVLFFESYNKCLINEFVFGFGQILFDLARLFAAHHERSFVPAFLRSLLITFLKSGKINYCFGRKS